MTWSLTNRGHGSNSHAVRARAKRALSFTHLPSTMNFLRWTFLNEQFYIDKRRRRRARNYNRYNGNGRTRFKLNFNLSDQWCFGEHSLAPEWRHFSRLTELHSNDFFPLYVPTHANGRHISLFLFLSECALSRSNVWYSSTRWTSDKVYIVLSVLQSVGPIVRRHGKSD